MMRKSTLLLMLVIQQSTSPSAFAFNIPQKLQRQQCRTTTTTTTSSSSLRTSYKRDDLSSVILRVAAEDQQQQQQQEELDDELTVPKSTEIHALEVFDKYASESSYDGSSIQASSDLYEILLSLDVEATQEEADVLFRYLDEDGDGQLDYEDFLPWYLDAAGAATAVAESFQSLLVGRRTIEEFDSTPVSNDVLTRAVQCALAAPNRSCSEPWRFIQIGPKTVSKFADLKAKLSKTMETENGTSSVSDWTKTVPGWCVVTTKLSPDNPETELEDFKSVSCAIQNFMLSMWSEGIGTKWTSGPVQKTQEFADICGVDTTTERVVGCIWYGYASGGAKYADPRRRRKTVQDVLSHLP